MSSPSDARVPHGDDRPLSVALVNDYQVVVAGLSTLLEPFSDRVVVRELDAGVEVVRPVDVALFDTFAQVQGEGLSLPDVVASAGLVLVYSWNDHAEAADDAFDSGAHGFVSKRVSAEDLVAAIEKVAAGDSVRLLGPEQPEAADMVVPDHVDVATPHDEDEARVGQPAWPAQEHGLSAREAEVIALVTRGMANIEIARACYLSINSVKTYVRTAYKKMGVHSRAQAVLWGLAHGLGPEQEREAE
ncbi:helix-turn-helix transcriptional regulator [Nocardioides bruguierae]|uniref:Response regulator transcription factor n=1 Tax=Nocardioides bruguierae TaxID=2945102 RepID=A0A9X2D777_9ACTN|nr:response regulator transcription factor [Nocardioides bruguierae]MCL8025561.1 response regulator transcription factor [Nocardioides bruguierae]MCM0620420.1 response regulator transcription factor [Nocardioides bruguierae]